MKRCIYRAKLKHGIKDVFNSLADDLKTGLDKFIQEEKLMTLSIFNWNDTLFLYYECIDEIFDPDKLVGELNSCLEEWPGLDSTRHWVPMMDIFHYNRPINTDHWRRKQPVQKRCARITRLKDDMFSSYIFYHYQLQEEKPSIVGNKYGIIAVHENLMFFYHEEPVVVEKPSIYEGKLKTQNTPPNWGELMKPHFIFWEDTEDSQKIWRNIDVVFEI